MRQGDLASSHLSADPCAGYDIFSRPLIQVVSLRECGKERHSSTISCIQPKQSAMAVDLGLDVDGMPVTPERHSRARVLWGRSLPEFGEADRLSRIVNVRAELREEFEAHGTSGSRLFRATVPRYGAHHNYLV